MWSKKKNKYSAQKLEHKGYSFASKGEAKLFDVLKLMERAKEIKDIQVQDSIYLTNARILYKPDYKYFSIKENEEQWAEFKGFETPEWRIKRRLWMHYGPGKLFVYESIRGIISLKETIIPKGDSDAI